MRSNVHARSTFSACTATFTACAARASGPPRIHRSTQNVVYSSGNQWTSTSGIRASPPPCVPGSVHRAFRPLHRLQPGVRIDELVVVPDPPCVQDHGQVDQDGCSCQHRGFRGVPPSRSSCPTSSALPPVFQRSVRSFFRYNHMNAVAIATAAQNCRTLTTTQMESSLTSPIPELARSPHDFSLPRM